MHAILLQIDAGHARRVESRHSPGRRYQVLAGYIVAEFV
jgi:hypothetical protein